MTTTALHPRALMARIAPRPAPTLSDQVEAVLATAAPRIAAAHPPVQPAAFADQLRTFAERSDKLVDDHNRLLEDHRVALAENELLRAQLTASQKYGDELREYWERQYETVTRDNRRLSRLYNALIGRFDGLIESLQATREAARREAFAPDADAEQHRQPGEAVVALNPRPEDEGPLPQTDAEAAEDIREHHRTFVPVNDFAPAARLFRS